MFGHCMVSTAYAQIRVWLVQSQATFITPPESVHPLHSLMPLRMIGSLLGQRLGHRPNTTATLGQCLMHACITWLWPDHHASFSGQTPLPSLSSVTARLPGVPLSCWDVWQDGKQSIGLHFIESDYGSWIGNNSFIIELAYVNLYIVG